MNAHTFGSYPATCPLCHRAGGIKPSKMFQGLLTCQHCQERLVVSWSGHFVRDPFTLKRLAMGRMLRQQSRPLARILRDFGIARNPSLVAVLSGTIFLGIAFLALKELSPAYKAFSQLKQPSTEVLKPTNHLPSASDPD